ncbi:MAG TPA: FAD-dependent oxidoreductase, partial [bacterium]|nr:FAD-dependent oxidoreductase [bacterium]
MNDTIVIGAGLAGLSAAKCLVGHGYSVVLIEARDRAGGRVWTQRPGTMEIPIDLGAEWIGAGQLREILERAGAKIQKARGTRWQCREGECRKLPDFSRLMEEFLKKARSVTATDLSVCEAFERCFLRQEREEDQRVLLGYIEGFHAADPAKAGLFWLDDVEDSDSAKEYEMRSPAGAGRAVDALLASIQSRCDIRFSTSAQEIRWQRGEVAVATLRQDGDRNVLRAASVVVTVPLPLLAGSDHEPTFRIVPALTEKLYAARQIEMGHVLKLVLRFHE